MLYVIFLKHGPNKDKASDFMPDHIAWLKEKIEQGKLLMYGGLNPQQGGAVLARGASKDEIEALIADDPFVTQNIVNVEINEIAPKGAGEALSFLLVN